MKENSTKKYNVKAHKNPTSIFTRDYFDNKKKRASRPDRHKNNERVNGWNAESRDYHKIVGEDGHYYHKNVVIPGTLRLLNLKPGNSLLDIGCGQGVLGRALPTKVAYTGVDNARELIELAKKLDNKPGHSYLVASATREIPIPKESFTHAAIVLALQNMELPQNAIKNASDALAKNGRLVIVINHPAFRIPRQSGWNIGKEGQQSRYINRYLSHLSIPIYMHPSRRNSPTTISYHFPLSEYSKMLNKSGFLIELIEEWVSDKKSEGSASKSENRARAEIPLFMAISCIKK